MPSYGGVADGMKANSTFFCLPPFLNSSVALVTVEGAPIPQYLSYCHLFGIPFLPTVCLFDRERLNKFFY